MTIFLVPQQIRQSCDHLFGAVQAADRARASGEQQLEQMAVEWAGSESALFASTVRGEQGQPATLLSAIRGE